MRHAISLAFALAAPAALAQPFEIDWYTIDGGGGTSSGGTYVLSGTIGQHDAGGTLAGGTYELTGGFWTAFTGLACDACVADVNSDGLASPADFTAWLAFFQNPALPGAECADVNRDGLLSPADFTAWLAAFQVGCP